MGIKYKNGFIRTYGGNWVSLSHLCYFYVDDVIDGRFHVMGVPADAVDSEWLLCYFDSREEAQRHLDYFIDRLDKPALHCSVCDDD